MHPWSSYIYSIPPWFAHTQDFVDDIKGELSGDFEKTVLALLMPPSHYLASEVKRAIKGLGTDEAVLIEIICTRTNEQMKELKEAYKKCEFGWTLLWAIDLGLCWRVKH